MSTNKNEHLQKVLETHDINKLVNIDKFIAKKNKVKEALNNKFSIERASTSIDSGSYAKKTARRGSRFCWLISTLCQRDSF